MPLKEKSDEEPAIEPKVINKLAIVGGVLLALFIAAVAAQLISSGRLNSQPYGDSGQIVLLVSLAVSFGYDLGLALKTEHPERGVFLFWASFLGTFLAIVIGAGIWSIVSGAPLTTLYSIAPLILGTGAFAVIIQSGLVEHSRMRFLKRGLDAFSNKISAALFGGYSAATVSDPFWGGVVGVVVLALAFGISEELPKLEQKLGRVR